MPLETGTFISDLVATNPAPNDAKSLGDDHLRLIKSTLKATLPNVSGAVTATHTELNFVTGLTAQAAAKDGSNIMTPAAGDYSTKIATTAFVANAAVTAALPGQMGNSGRFLGTDGTTATWRQVYPNLSSSTAGKVLSNDGTTTSWVQSIPVISSGVNGKLLSNDGTNTTWVTPTPCLPLAGGDLAGPVAFANSVPVRMRNSVGTAFDFAYVSADNFTNVFDSGGNGVRLWNQAGTVILLGVDPSGTIVARNHMVFPQSAGIFLRDPGGNARQLVKMDGAEVNFTVAGGSSINFYNQAGNAVVATLSNAGTFTAVNVGQSSDERKKKLWQRVPHDFISRLAGLRKSGIFHWKKGGAVGVGVGAQSLEAIFPEAVHTDEKGNKSVFYGAAALVACVELAREVEALKKLVKK